MGACDFTSHAFDKDGNRMEKCFREAVREAQWEHGHGGYTGTIAEKGSVVLIPEVVAETWEEGDRLAYKMIHDDDDRIDDKWGPAGAIRVKNKGWVFFGMASS